MRQKLSSKKGTVGQHALTQTPLAKDPRLLTYVARLRQVYAAIKKQEEKSKELQAELQEVAQNLLPNIFAEFEITDLTLADGAKLKLGDHLTASISERNEKEAKRLLKKIKAEDIEQDVVTFKLLPSEKKLKELLTKFATKQKLPYEVDVKVNAQTLKAVVRRALDAGQLSPKELPWLGVWVTKQVTLKEPKQD